MGKEKVVLDTNVLISAFKWGGRPKQVFNKMLDKEAFELFMSKEQLKELESVLDYPRFGFSGKQKSEILELVLAVATIVEIKNEVHIIPEDPDDDVIINTAIENDVGYIVSGDNHLLKRREYRDVKIVTPAEFLRLHP